MGLMPRQISFARRIIAVGSNCFFAEVASVSISFIDTSVNFSSIQVQRTSDDPKVTQTWVKPCEFNNFITHVLSFVVTTFPKMGLAFRSSLTFAKFIKFASDA
jgi:hypothetical protein